MKYQFRVEIELLGKTYKADLEADTPDEAVEEMFKAMRKQVKIKDVTKPNTPHNIRATIENKVERSEDHDIVDTPFGKMKIPKKKNGGTNIIDDLLNSMKNPPPS